MLTIHRSISDREDKRLGDLGWRMEEECWRQVRKRSRRSILEELAEVPGGRVVRPYTESVKYDC